MRYRQPIRLLLVLTLSLMATGSVARAATFWVSPSGSGTGTRADSTTSDSTHAKSLAWFNTNAIAGDICRFKSGTYTDPIYPKANGTASSRIRYYAFPSDPSAVTVAYLRFGDFSGSAPSSKGDYCTARWVTCTGSIMGSGTGSSGFYSSGDSVVRCVALGQDSTALTIAGPSSVFDSLTVTGTMNFGSGPQPNFIAIAGERCGSCDTTWAWGSKNNRLTNSTFNCTVTAAPSGSHFLLVSTATDNLVNGNTFNITCNQSSGYWFGAEFYEGYRTALTNNAWNITYNATNTGSAHSVISYRDSSSYNRAVGNTITISGSGSLGFSDYTNPGSFPNTCTHNYLGNNVVKVPSPNGSGVFDWSSGCTADTVEFNVVTVNASVPLFNAATAGGTSPFSGLVMRHNTLFTAGSTAIDFSNASGTGRLTSSIYYGATPDSSGHETVKVPASGFGLDSAGVFFNPGGSSSNAIRVGSTDGAPGSGGSYGLSGMAVWGDPYFQDSTYATFDPHLRNGSAAVSKCLWDAFAGVYNGTDVTAPGAVTDLTLNSGRHTIVANWTAPGDDGTCGTAASYDLRISTSAINAGNFSSATHVTTSVPQPAGSAECVVASGLSVCTTYYLALKTTDAASNTSSLSNLPSVTTRCSGTAEVSCDAGGGGAAVRPRIDPDDGNIPRLTLQSSPDSRPGSGIIRLGVPRGGQVGVDVGLYDVTGRRLATLFRGDAPSGWQTLEPAPSLRAGMYYVRLRAPGVAIARSVIILR